MQWNNGRTGRPVFESLYGMASFLATFFTWFVIALRAATIFLFRQVKRKLLDGTLGFARGDVHGNSLLVFAVSHAVLGHLS